MSEDRKVLYKCIKYIDNDTDLLKILLLNRGCSKMFRKPVYKQALLRASQDNLKKKRSALWIKLMDVEERTYAADYKAHCVLAQQDLNK